MEEGRLYLPGEEEIVSEQNEYMELLFGDRVKTALFSKKILEKCRKIFPKGI